MNTARAATAGAGIATAALVFAGASGTGTLTESFNGTNWTEVNDLNQTS